LECGVENRTLQKEGAQTDSLRHIGGKLALASKRMGATSPLTSLRAYSHSGFMKLFAICAAVLLVGVVAFAAAASVHEIKLNTLEGKPTTLGAYKGKVILLVNVASQCGLTPQYTALEALHKKYQDKGFTVIGVPCNDFGSQEPGTAEEIREFCSSKHNVTFPLMEKIHVKGSEQHPLYARLTGKGAEFPGDIKWNFGKFLIGRDGKVLQRFEPQTKPDSDEVIKAVEAALQQPASK
jgi:glutathione peroxidase